MRRSQQIAEESLSLTVPQHVRAAPITRIPPEVLLRIIEFSLKVFTLKDSHQLPVFHRKSLPECEQFESSQPPWVYTHVCKNWRDLLSSSPVLWTHYQLRKGNQALAYSAQQRIQQFDLRRWDIHQERSRQLPMQLSVDLRSRLYHPILGKIFEEALAPRWTKVQILVPSVHMADLLDTSLDPFGTFSKLTYLQLTVEDDNRRQALWPRSKSKVFADALCLRTLHITAQAAEHFEFPWHVLKHLSLARLDNPPRTMRQILRLTTSLQSLSVGFAFGRGIGDDEDFDSREPVTLPHLRELVLDEMTEYTKLANIISTPALQRLACLEDIEEYIPLFSDSLQKAPCSKKLTHLCIRNFALEHLRLLDSFQGVLEELPSLLDLRLTFTRLPDPEEEWERGPQLLEHLEVRGGMTKVLCPRLQRLDLQYIIFEPTTLLQFLSSRLRAEPSVERHSDYTPCLLRFVVCFPYGCFADEERCVWSPQQRSQLSELLDNHTLQEYNIYAPHSARSDKDDLEVGNVNREPDRNGRFD